MRLLRHVGVVLHEDPVAREPGGHVRRLDVSAPGAVDHVHVRLHHDPEAARLRGKQRVQDAGIGGRLGGVRRDHRRGRVGHVPRGNDRHAVRPGGAKGVERHVRGGAPVLVPGPRGERGALLPARRHRGGGQACVDERKQERDGSEEGGSCAADHRGGTYPRRRAESRRALLVHRPAGGRLEPAAPTRGLPDPTPASRS